MHMNPVTKLGVFFLMTMLFGCGKEPSGSAGGSDRTAPQKDLPTVKVTINTWPGLGPYYVARAKGFDREEGIRLEVIMNEDTVGRNTALASGEVDLVGITLDTVIIARAQGLAMTVVAQSDFSNGGDGIIANKGITKVAELRGKKVACPVGLPSHFFLLNLLDREGMGPKDVELVPADDGGQAALLFTSGKVDAAVTWDPWISRAESLTKGHVLITTKDAPRLVLGIVAANKKMLAQRADRIVKAQRAWFKAVTYCQQHPDEAAAIMAKEYNVPVEDFKRMATGAQLADLQETMQTFGTRQNPGPIYKLAQDAVKLWLKAGVINKPVSPEDAVDWTIVEKLAADAK